MHLHFFIVLMFVFLLVIDPLSIETLDDNVFFLSVAYAPDSTRSLQMLSIIDLLLPKYLEQLKSQTMKKDVRIQAREEVKSLEKLSVSMRTMINVLECLTRTFVEPKHESITNPIHRHVRSSSRSASIMIDEDSMR